LLFNDFRLDRPWDRRTLEQREMGQWRSIGVAELVQQIADEAFPEDGSGPVEQALLYDRCRRLARVASLRLPQARDLVALARTARDERVKAVAMLAVLELADEMSTDNGAEGSSIH
jgi:hypothetical protein